MLLDELNKVITILKERLRISEIDRIRLRDLLRTKAEYEKELSLILSLISLYKVLLNEIEDYQSIYKSKAINDVYRALYATRNIIPDCDEINPLIENGSFTLVDKDNLPITEIEGGGVQAAASVLVRHSILARTEYLPFMILDESVATVSDINSSTFSKYLPLLAADVQITMIEQKPTVFDNSGDIKSYHVVKVDGISEVE